MQRSPGSCPTTAQRDSGGSPTVHPWTGVELGAIHCALPTGYPSVTLPLQRGPVHCASCAAKAKQISAHFGFALAFPSPARRENVPGRADEGILTLTQARTMRAIWGPYAAAKWWRNCPKGGSHGCEPVGCQSRDGLSANPGTASWSQRAGARRPLYRGGLLFGYFLLATQEKVTRSPEASDTSAGMPRSEGACFESRKWPLVTKGGEVEI